MSASDLILALFVQPEYGLPLLVLAGSLIAWWSWEAGILPAALAPYSLRRPWLIDSVRVLHEALSADELAPTIQVTYTWLSHEVRQAYGIPITHLVRLRGYFLGSRVPSRPQIRRAVRSLRLAFLYAQYAEDSSAPSWFAAWRRPRARARARRIFGQVLGDLEELQTALGPNRRGAVS